MHQEPKAPWITDKCNGIVRIHKDLTDNLQSKFFSVDKHPCHYKSQRHHVSTEALRSASVDNDRPYNVVQSIPLSTDTLVAIRSE